LTKKCGLNKRLVNLIASGTAGKEGLELQVAYWDWKLPLPQKKKQIRQAVLKLAQQQEPQ
jgi:hypothetical protein